MSKPFFDSNAKFKRLKLHDVLPTDEEIQKYKYEVWYNTPSTVYHYDLATYVVDEKKRKGPKNYKPLKHFFK